MQYEKTYFSWMNIVIKSSNFFCHWLKNHPNLLEHFSLYSAAFPVLSPGPGSRVLGPSTSWKPDWSSVLRPLWIFLQIGFPLWKQRKWITSDNVLESTLKAFTNKHILRTPGQGGEMCPFQHSQQCLQGAGSSVFNSFYILKKAHIGSHSNQGCERFLKPIPS